MAELHPIWDGRHNLANFALVPVSILGRFQVPTSEHAYQMLKFSPSHPEIMQLIKEAPTPHDAKQITAKNKDKIRKDWPVNRCKRMAVVMRNKIRQNPELQQELLETGDKYIYEAADEYASENPTDQEIAEMRRWGIYQGEGENWIGEILMHFRTQLQENGVV